MQAGGNSGQFIVQALLKTGKHTVTAISRIGSNSALPEGIEVKKVSYDNELSLVKALQGQDALIITLGGLAPPDQQTKLIDAAAEAGVRWIFPNEWSPDTANEDLVKDVIPFQSKPRTRDYIAKLGKSSYIAVTTGFWYEWSLPNPTAYGFDFKNRAVTLFDNGETQISTSTWPQIGRAVAGLLSLPIKPEDEDQDRCLERFRNSQIYVSSFTVSQRDILDSVLRVTQTTLGDWTLTKEPVKERYSEGIAAMKTGDRIGFAKMMYGRVFFPDDCGNFEKTKGTINSLIGLPKEDLDEATRAAIKRVDASTWH